MNIDSIQNGYIIDHIRVNKGMEIYRYLNLDDLDCSVAIIRNVKSSRMGKKDIIKIDALIPVQWDSLGYIDPDVTVNVIENGVLIEKKTLQLPRRVVNVIHCHNPRCITQTERGIDSVFVLADDEKRTYRCLYCETAYKAT